MALADRSKNASTEEDFQTGDDSSETSKLFQERLGAWHKVVDNLTDYIHSTEKLQSTHAKEYEKQLKTVTHQLGESFAPNLGGVRETLDNVKTNTQAIANSHADTARALKSTVLPTFERLDTEIKQKQKELKKGTGKGSKAVDKARAATQKHVEHLGQYSAQIDSGTAGRIDPDKDPYVLHRGIMHRLHKQITEENGIRQDILAVQENFSQFEAHVVQTVQQGMGQFYTTMANQAGTSQNLYGSMVQKSQGQDPLFEWQNFLKRNNHLLIDPSAPPRSVQNTSFPNQNHSTTQALCQGALERKQGLLKKYDASVYAISPAGYLHEFKSDNDVENDPTPDLSLYLPECQVGGINGNNFIVKGKDLSSKLKLGGAKEYEFRARTDQDAETWWRIIREVCSGQTHASGAASPRVGDTQSPGVSLRDRSQRIPSGFSQQGNTVTSPRDGRGGGGSEMSTLNEPTGPPHYELVGGENGEIGKVVFPEEAVAVGEKRGI